MTLRLPCILLSLCLVAAGCSDAGRLRSDGEQAAEDVLQVDAAEVADSGVGGALIRPVAPPEASDLWPLPAGWRLLASRRAGHSAAELLHTVAGPHEAAIRLQPFAGVATTFQLELRDGADALRAQAFTAPAIYDQVEADRQIVAFLLPPDALVSAVDAQGVAVKLPGLLGGSATTMATGEVLLAGGSLYAGGAPCDVDAVGAPTETLWRYDPADGGLNAFAKLKTARSFHVALPLSPIRLAVLGGQISATAAGGMATASVELIRSDVGAVQVSAQPLSVPRARACGAAVGGRLVIAGGLGQAGSSAELWDPAIGTVGQPITLSPPRYDAGCVSARDPANERDLVFIVGGRSASGPVNDVVIVAVEDTGLVTFAPLLLPAGPLHQAFVHVPDKSFALLVAGGFGGGDTGSPSAKSWMNLFSASSGSSWQPTADLSTARGCAAAAVLSDGSRALLFGGMAANGEPTAAIDQVMLDGGAKVDLNVALPQPRAGAVAVALLDGTILLSGGLALVSGAAKTVDGVLRFAPPPGVP